jgi:hypothetical protein
MGREERDRQKQEALQSWQGLAKPWMVDGEEGVKVSSMLLGSAI